MTARIKASCPDCGEVELTAADINLMLCKNDEGKSYYSFCCPTCVDIVRKPADKNTIGLLLSGGVKPTGWHIPAEALEQHRGPELNSDDLLDFLSALAQADFMNELLEET